MLFVHVRSYAIISERKTNGILKLVKLVEAMCYGLWKNIWAAYFAGGLITVDGARRYPLAYSNRIRVKIVFQNTSSVCLQMGYVATACSSVDVLFKLRAENKPFEWYDLILPM